MKDDIDVLDFARMISMLPRQTPITDCFDKNYGQKENRWWSCQREHLTAWCLGQPTKGVKGFERRKPNDSARTMYNYLACPAALLWLAEALGEDEQTLNTCVEGKPLCSEFRNLITFNRILELMKNNEFIKNTYANELYPKYFSQQHKKSNNGYPQYKHNGLFVKNV